MERTIEERLAMADKLMNKVSHDIRTPLNAVIGYSTLLKEVAEDSGKVREYAHKINLAGNVLMSLINDILEMSRLRNGNVKLTYEEFDVTSLIEQVTASIKPQSEKKMQLLITNIIGYAQDVTVIGDRSKLCGLLINLLSNAVKYTPEKGCIKLTAEMNSDCELKVVIKDNGVGMSEDFLKSAFEPFAREEGSQFHKSKQTQGTGLGLPIAKELAEMMGGSISVVSKSGEGTEVTVQVKVSAVEKDGMNNALSSEAPGIPPGGAAQQRDACKNIDEPLKGMTFLLAEDNELNREITEEMLALKGAVCISAGNGREVVEKFIKSAPGRFDAVLMDVQMPVMDGYEATRNIRESDHPDGKYIPVIAMTANAFEEDVQNAFEAGMDAHISKPVNLNVFINMVTAIKKTAGHRQSESA